MGIIAFYRWLNSRVCILVDILRGFITYMFFFLRWVLLTIYLEGYLIFESWGIYKMYFISMGSSLRYMIYLMAHDTAPPPSSLVRAGYFLNHIPITLINHRIFSFLSWYSYTSKGPSLTSSSNPSNTHQHLNPSD